MATAGIIYLRAHATAGFPTLAYGTNAVQLGIDTTTQYLWYGDASGNLAVKMAVANCVGAAPLASPTFTGTPLAPTAAVGTSTTQLATTAFVATAAPLASRVNADLTNATTTFSAMTGLSATLTAAHKYTGRLVVKANDSTAAEGIKFDFAGGTATMTSFWACAAQLVGGTVVLGTVISTSLAGVVNFTTITGETLIAIDFSLVVNGAGTLIPRFAQNSHAVGTATVELGSFMHALDTP